MHAIIALLYLFIYHYDDCCSEILLTIRGHITNVLTQTITELHGPAMITETSG